MTRKYNQKYKTKPKLVTTKFEAETIQMIDDFEPFKNINLTRSEKIRFIVKTYLSDFE